MEMTAAEVLDLAKSKNSLIHDYFEWNDSKAAHRYRIKQAEGLIRYCVVEEQGVEIREYVTPVIVDEEEGTRKYVHINKARRSPHLWKQVVDNAMREATAWRDRYEVYKELAPIRSAITRVESKRKRRYA
jgi:hypothetical protein